MLGKHPHFAAGGQFRTQARKGGAGEWHPGPRPPSAAPLASRPPAPLPRAGERQNAVSGNALTWLGSAPDFPDLQAHGLEWAEPSAQGHGAKN